MSRFASSQKAQLRRQFLAEEAASGFASASGLQATDAAVTNLGTGLVALDQVVAHEIGDRTSEDGRIEAKVDANKASSDAADAALAASVSGLEILDAAQVASIAGAAVDAALPVVDPPLADPDGYLDVVVDAALGTKKRLVFGTRGQIAAIQDPP